MFSIPLIFSRSSSLTKSFQFKVVSSSGFLTSIVVGSSSGRSSALISSTIEELIPNLPTPEVSAVLNISSSGRLSSEDSFQDYSFILSFIWSSGLRLRSCQVCRLLISWHPHLFPCLSWLFWSPLLFSFVSGWF